MVKKTQSIESKNPPFLALLHPDWFLPFIHRDSIKKLADSLKIVQKYWSKNLKKISFQLCPELKESHTLLAVPV